MQGVFLTVPSEDLREFNDLVEKYDVCLEKFEMGPFLLSGDSTLHYWAYTHNANAAMILKLKWGGK